MHFCVPYIACVNPANPSTPEIQELTAQITLDDVNLLHENTLWPEKHSELITTFSVVEEKDFEIAIFVRPIHSIIKHLNPRTYAHTHAQHIHRSLDACIRKIVLIHKTFHTGFATWICTSTSRPCVLNMRVLAHNNNHYFALARRSGHVSCNESAKWVCEDIFL